MPSSKAAAYLELLRPVNVAIALVSIAVATILAGMSLTAWPQMVLAMLAGGLIAGGANAINDYFDVAIDAVNRPNRPLPRGALTRQDALRVWWAVSLVGISLNVFLNSGALAIASLAVLLLYLYSARLKRTVLWGNLTVALMTGMAFIYGGVVAGSVERAVVPSVFAFLVNLARELIKDAEDVEGDRLHAAGTLAVKKGTKTALAAGAAVLILLIATTVLVYLLGQYNSTYFVVVLFVDAALTAVIFMILSSDQRVHLARASTILKLSMIGGLLAIYLGS